MSVDTVGSLLANIATSLQDGLRILMFADKRGWGPDEFEQVRALEEALDEAKKDFQDMAPLVNGQLYYEKDRRSTCACTTCLFTPHPLALALHFTRSSCD